MTVIKAVRVLDDRTWPLTSDARGALVTEIAKLRQDLTTLAGQGLEEGILSLPVAKAARRLETLDRILGRAALADDGSCAIGRRATIRGDDGEVTSYAIVLPGDGDPVEGSISADSPVGAAILGARVGDTVDVDAPAGRWTVTLVSIE
jgi:transcription elongation GreA/GreB family factor